MDIWKSSWQSKCPGTPKQVEHWLLRDSDFLSIYSAVSDVLSGMWTTIQNLLLTGQIMRGDCIQMVENRLQWTLINKESPKDSSDFCQEALMMMSWCRKRESSVIWRKRDWSLGKLKCLKFVKHSTQRGGSYRGGAVEIGIIIHLSLWLNILLHKHSMKFNEASWEQSVLLNYSQSSALGDMWILTS